MWNVLAKMDVLEELRVRLRPPLVGWIGPKERHILDSIWKLPKPLKVFDVEVPWISPGRGQETDEAGEKDACLEELNR